MTAPALFLLLIDLSMAQRSQSVSFNLSLKEVEGSGRLMNETAVLSAIDDHDTFCKGNTNVIFPHPSAFNVYYRCNGNRRETWECIGDSYFDGISQRCVQSERTGQDSSAATVTCWQQEDGLYPVYNSNCKQYVRCKGGMRAEVKQCPADERFSYGRQSCASTSGVACVRSLCSPDNDDFFIIPGSKCRAYYVCRQGKRFDFVCGRGRTFDLQTKSCVDGGICYEPICTGRINGIYTDTTHSCNRYFQCSGGEMLTVASCPRNMKHNGRACTAASEVRCEAPEKTAAVFYNSISDECKLMDDGNHIVPGTDCRMIRICARGRTVTTMECPDEYRYDGSRCLRRELTQCDNRCSGRHDGYYPDESGGCREYYLCQSGKVTEWNKCGNGQTFDGRFCSSSLLSSCSGKSREVACAGLPDGYHPNYFNGCRDYFYCHNQQVIEIKTCDAGAGWNGSRCVGNGRFRCDDPEQLPQCAGLPVGLYQDLSSKCRNYIYCNSGAGTVLSCSDGKIYDGSKCRDSSEYTCPTDVRDECYNQPDGYKQDKYSNCRSYFFCSGGSKTTYVCNENHVYNGSHCVPPEQYSCPYNISDCEGKYNGYYPDAATNCKRYFFCLDGRRVTTINCGGKKIYNGKSCVLVGDAEKACTAATRNPCRSRRDGKYLHKSPQCERYIRCSNQTLTEETPCRDGSSVNQVTRPSKGEKNNCRTGFVQDYASGCKKYYFCVGNMKMTAVCPGGTIFNGKVCQDSRTYKCPRGSEIE